MPTITEKILAKHCGKSSVKPGEFIEVKVDFCFGNDITAPIAIERFRSLGKAKVFDKSRVALVPDHFIPAKDMRSANQAKILKDFADEFAIKNYFEAGRMGVEHALLPELGLIKPGELIIGADSHTCTHGALGCFAAGVGSTDLAYAFATGRCWLKVPHSMKFILKGKPPKWVGGKDIILHIISDIGVDGATYRSMEFTGSAMSYLSIDDRFTICNMAVEAGAKNGIIEADGETERYVKSAVRKNKPQRKSYTIVKSDKDARYVETRQYSINNLEPCVAIPHLPSNSKPVSKVKNVNVDQVVIGSCTNGRMSDLRAAAKVLKGKRVRGGVRLIVIPATQKIYLDAVKEGLAKIFIESGGVFSTPTCGPCLGGHMGILAEGEVAVSTTNRNFVGRMGHPKSFVYLSNPAVAAASAVKGKIAHPGEVM